VGLQLILGNASVMVKPMPATKAGKVAIGNVGNELDSASVWDGVVRLPAMRLPMQR
jgi:hypothetical protein